MKTNLAKSQLIIDYWRSAGDVSPGEFIILNALTVACYRQINDGLLMTATIADVSHISGLSREAVRRALLSLAERGLIRGVSHRWIPNEIELPEA